jgi:hypothetical protein
LIARARGGEQGEEDHRGEGRAGSHMQVEGNEGRAGTIGTA